MKKFTLIISALILCISLMAQPPQGFKYQAVVRDAAGEIVANQSVGFRLSIRQGSTSGTIVYRETQTATTNAFGLANLVVGSGTPVIGFFPDINWRDGQKFLQVETNLTGSYVTMGTAELMSVPFALYDGDWIIDGNDLTTALPGNVGIGVSSPTQKLQVAGVIHSTTGGIEYPDGTLQNTAAQTFTLPYDGTSASSPAFSITNPTGSIAIRGLATNSGTGISYGGYFESYMSEGKGVTGAVNGASAYGVYGLAQGLNGYGVRGEATGANGVGVYGSGPNKAGYFDGDVYALGDVGIGVFSPFSKLHVHGSYPSTNTVEDVLTIARGSTGTVVNGEGAGLTFYNEVSNDAYALSGRISAIMENVIVPNTTAGMLFETRALGGAMTDAMYIDPDGKVGFGTTNPLSTIDVYGDQIIHNTSALGNAFQITGSTSAALAYIPNNGTGWGLSAGVNNSGASSSSYGLYGFNYSPGYGVYGKNYHASGTGTYGINTSAGNYGYLGGSAIGAYGEHNNGNYGYLGGTSYGVYGVNYGGNYGNIGAASYGVYGYLATTAAGNYAIYGYGVHYSGVEGTGYGESNTLGGVKGYNYWGNQYTFGVAGYSYLDYGRSGGNFGGNYTGTIWGCMAYKTSTSATYGGYFTSYTTGTGKDSQPQINNGIAAYGDLFGADIHGQVYGAFIEGENYATFANGDVFKNGLDVHIQENGTNQNTVLYTSVATDVTIQTSGYASISGGKANITFDQSFSQAVSGTEPIIVTVTPMGNSNGVYLSTVDKNGFSVVENNDGKSNVTVSYIAIGKRKGYESPRLPEEVISADYTTKVQQGLHNDNDTETNGKGLYYENGKLFVGVHPSTLADPGKEPAKVLIEPKPGLPIDKNNTDGKGQDNEK